MAFEKKIWLNVPDPLNPPEPPEGQDSLAVFDADNMNRIESGIFDLGIDLNTAQNSMVATINKYIDMINKSSSMVCRDKDGKELAEVLNWGCDEKIILDSISNKIDNILSFHLDLIGKQSNKTIKITTNFRWPGDYLYDIADQQGTQFRVEVYSANRVVSLKSERNYRDSNGEFYLNLNDDIVDYIIENNPELFLLVEVSLPRDYFISSSSIQPRVEFSRAFRDSISYIEEDLEGGR